MIDHLIWLLAFLTSIVVSTLLIRWGIPRLKAREVPAQRTPIILPESRGGIFDLASVGFWIGFFESLLIFLFIYIGQPTGLGLILAAKGLVRKDAIEKDPSYYLLGFLMNIAIAVFFAVDAASVT